jgi:hypothetical protein
MIVDATTSAFSADCGSPAAVSDPATVVSVAIGGCLWNLRFDDWMFENVNIRREDPNFDPEQSLFQLDVLYRFFHILEYRLSDSGKVSGLEFFKT